MYSPNSHTNSLQEIAHAQPLCPICGGVFLRLGGGFRCTRCQFATCEGCEGTNAENECSVPGLTCAD
jgi:tRNA(Ile2) C34 agmatinyltransferase TiaS